MFWRFQWLSRESFSVFRLRIISRTMMMMMTMETKPTKQYPFLLSVDNHKLWANFRINQEAYRNPFLDMPHHPLRHALIAEHISNTILHKIFMSWICIYSANESNTPVMFYPPAHPCSIPIIFISVNIFMQNQFDRNHKDFILWFHLFLLWFIFNVLYLTSTWKYNT